MQLLLVIVVGYIIGVIGYIWGLYLKTSMVLLCFLGLGGALILIKKRDLITKYKLHIMLFVLFSFISFIQITILENKFDNLYNGVSEVKAVRYCYK